MYKFQLYCMCLTDGVFLFTKTNRLIRIIRSGIVWTTLVALYDFYFLKITDL